MSPDASATARERALVAIAASADTRDRVEGVPPFPEEAVAQLEGAGLLAATLPGRVAGAAAELSLVREVARADGSVGRILDGHLNAVERLAVQARPDLRDAQLEQVATGRLRLGVWGADPAPGEGEPATLRGDRLWGAKVFCSGAGGLDRALVLVREPGADRAERLAYVDLADRVEIDESWYRGAGMRASASHRVLFSGAQVVAVLGGPGALTEEPWFSRDAVRTAATWAGIADAAAEAALETLRGRADAGPLEGLAAGRIATAAQTIDLWVDEAARRLDAGTDLPTFAVHMRDALASSARAVIDEALRATGSRPLAVGGRLDRARRDLDVFLLQHRLDPLVARTGMRALAR